MSTAVFHPTDLEPNSAGSSTYVSRRRLGRVDAAAVFAGMVCMLTVIPTVDIVPSTSGDIGRPAVILCMGMFFWWLASRAHPRLVMTGRQPIRWAVLIFFLSFLVSYAAGFHRGLTSMEANAADRLLLGLAAFFGVILLAADGLSNWDRARHVLRVAVWCCAFMSLIGVMQVALPVDPVSFLHLPGLQAGTLIGLQERGSGVRVAATTSHYLELCSTLALVWPFAVHFAIYSGTAKQRRRYAVAAVMIAFGVLMTLSRTGIIAVVIGALMLMPLWTWRRRYNTLALGAATFGALTVAAPNMANTIFTMFSDADKDPSITSRTERYELAGFYFAQRPWLGRGSGTWVPPMYQYFDNQWLRTALEAGIIGVAAMAVFHLIALTLALVAMRRASTTEDRHICLALASTQVMAMFIAYTFDSMAYSTYVMMLGIMVGLCGTVWRFTHPARTIRTSAPQSLG